LVWLRRLLCPLLSPVISLGVPRFVGDRVHFGFAWSGLGQHRQASNYLLCVRLGVTTAAEQRTLPWHAPPLPQCVAVYVALREGHRS
jgi:hypothetical protein